MATWTEIKKLAADLHRVQLGESVKKLSERNCVEVITDLINNGLIDVVFSLDGKEYITRDYLRIQIVNETLANEGRINLVDLQKILNVEYQNIENECKHITDSRSDYTLVLGQLINRDYFNKIFREVDEKLQELGRLTLSDITKCYDLPTDLLVAEIIGQLGGEIKASVDSVDSSVLYTDSYVQLQKCILRGALLAVTKPIQVHKITHELGIEPGLFFALFDSLSSAREIRGSLSGGKLIERAVFIPDLYVEWVERYIKNFYYQNGYVELSDVKKLASTTDSLPWLLKLLNLDESALVCLKSVVVGREVLDQIEICVEEQMQKHLWADVSVFLPISLPKADLQYLVDYLHKKHRREWNLCGECGFYDDSLLDIFIKLFESKISEKAALDSPNLSKLLRHGDSQAMCSSVMKETGAQINVEAKGKGGKGAQEKGRNKKRNVESNALKSTDVASSTREPVIFMSHDELMDYIGEQCQGDSYPDDVIDDVCRKIASKLNAKYKEELESIYLNTQSTNLKKSHGEFTDKFRLLYQNVCLFDAGTEIFNETVSEQLKAYLLRTLCNDLVNLAVGFYGHVPNANQMTPKIRDATVESFNSAAKSTFHRLISSLNSKNLNSFYDALDDVLSPSICSLNVKKPDKKSRTELIDRYQKELYNQLAGCQDFSMALLLACLILIVKCHSNVMIHASGKFVPQIVAELQDKTSKAIHTLLVESQRIVVQSLKSKDNLSTEEAGQKINELKEQVLKYCSSNDAANPD